MNLRRFGWAGLVGLALLSACDQRRYLLFTTYSFDADTPPPGWMQSARSTDHPHSAPYCSWVGLGREFSDGYSAPLGLNSSAVPRRVRVRAWVWLTNAHTRGAALVLAVQCHGRGPDVWQMHPLHRLVTRSGQWEQVEVLFRLPGNLQLDDQLKVFGWQSSPAAPPIYFDDIQLDTWRYSD